MCVMYSCLFATPSPWTPDYSGTTHQAGFALQSGLHCGTTTCRPSCHVGKVGVLPAPYAHRESTLYRPHQLSLHLRRAKALRPRATTARGIAPGVLFAWSPSARGRRCWCCPVPTSTTKVACPRGSGPRGNASGAPCARCASFPTRITEGTPPWRCGE